MKRLLGFLLVIVLSGIMFNSCSDDANKPSETKELFPHTNGSYWIYTRAYVEDGQDKSTTDSVVISGTEVVLNQTASKYSAYNEGTLLENYYRYSVDSKLYALPSELLPADIMRLIPSQILPQAWVVIADDKGTTWDMFSFDVTQIPLDLGGASAVLNGQIKVTGTKGTTMNVEVNGSSKSAQEFVTRITYTGTVNYSGANLPLEFSVETKSFFVDKIGLVKTETPKQDIAITLLGQKFPLYTIEAYSRTLVKSVIVVEN